MNTVTALCMWVALFLVKIVVSVIGLVWIPFCLIGVKIPKDLTTWRMVSLNSLGWPYQNLRDGCLGDIRLNFWNGTDQYPQWMKNWPYIKAWYWMSVRNPFNRNRYIPGLGCNLVDCKVFLLAGQHLVSDTKESYGWQFVKADGPIFNYYGFYCYKPIYKDKYFLRIRLGHKVETRYNFSAWRADGRASKSWKGTTFGISIRGER